MTEKITVAEVKKVWLVKIGSYFTPENRQKEWLVFKRMCLEKRWTVEAAYDYLEKFRWWL